ncbi:hypothetical protein A5647_09375 [Mycobacterium sp. 1100029.7]|nr:hypothetical protein A5647_09375 [Mycobacterium sp. 1100029.7]
MELRKAALIAAITAATAGVLTPPAHAEAGSFQSPSGNIYCLLGAETDGTSRADCQVQQHTYPVPPPGDCHLGGWGGQFSVKQGDPVELVCQGGVLTGPPMPTLGYGETRSIGAITCKSEPVGVTCTDDSTGHFFRASRDSYQLG